MELGTRYLLWSALRALNVANARTPLALDGPGAVPAFAFGLPTSELAGHAAGAYAASAVAAVARGAHRSTAGKLGLALTGAGAAALWQLQRSTDDADRIVERALRDQLGDDYRDHLPPPPMAPRTTALPTVPTPKVRARYVEHGHIGYGDAGARNTLDIWRRPDLPADGKAPVLLQIHGGAWIYGDKEGQAYPLMVHLAERGWICVSATYRLSPRATWPDHIVDVKRALVWVKEHIADHGGDPDQVVISGGSAGGHLTALAALTPNDPQFQPGFEDADTSVRAAVPFYGVYDWTNRDETGSPDLERLLGERIVKQTRIDAEDLYDQASPMSHVSADAVPMMLLHGTNDSLVPVAQARSMVDMLRAVSSNPVVYAEFPGAQHAYDVFSSNRTDASVAGIERFLAAVLAPSRVEATQVSSTT